MRDVRIRPEQLADTIKKELDDLAEDTTDTVKKAVQEAADTAVKDLKAASPRHTGKYAKSWTQKKVKDNSSEISADASSGKWSRETWRRQGCRQSAYQAG